MNRAGGAVFDWLSMAESRMLVKSSVEECSGLGE